MDFFKPIFQLTAPLYRGYHSTRGAVGAVWGMLHIVFGVIGFFANIIIITFAVLSGNFIGDRLRAQIANERGHQLEFIHQDEHGNTFLAANLLLSNFLPGIFLALLFRPRVVFAFLGGLVASFFLGDSYEDRLWETMDDFLSGGDPTRNWPTSAGQVELTDSVPGRQSKARPA